jgi:hypothetical protein
MAFRYITGRGLVPGALLEAVESPPAETVCINVVFTDLAATEVALKRAVDLVSPPRRGGDWRLAILSPRRGAWKLAGG